MDLTDVQIDALLQPIAGARVHRDGKGFSHVEAYDCRRRMTEIFGFGGWSGDLLSIGLLFEQEVTLLRKDKQKQPIPGTEYQAWTIAYQATFQVTILATGATYTEAATGSATNQPDRADAHDLALKTAESQAFKRCVVNLGNQYGISLYDNGSTGPFVRYVLGDRPAKWTPEGVVRPTQTAPAETGDHVTEQLAPESPAAADGAADSPPPQDNTPEGASTLPARAKDAHDAPTADAGGPGVPAPPQDSLPLGGGEALPTVQDMLNDEVATVLAGDLPSQKKRGALTKILLRASEARVEDALVYDGNGDAVSLKARIAAAVIQAGR